MSNLNRLCKLATQTANAQAVLFSGFQNRSAYLGLRKPRPGHTTNPNLTWVSSPEVTYVASLLVQEGFPLCAANLKTAYSEFLYAATHSDRATMERSLSYVLILIANSIRSMV